MRKLNRVVIKEELVKLTGNYKKALTLNQFLYWTERIGFQRYDKFIKEETDRFLGDTENLEGGWIYKKSEELAGEIMITGSPKTARRYCNQLVKDGYLLERKNPKIKWDHTKQYRVNLLKIKTDLDNIGYDLQGYRFDDEPLKRPNCQNDDSDCQNDDSNCQNDDSNCQDDDTIPEITTECSGSSNNWKQITKTYEKVFSRMISPYQIELIQSYIDNGMDIEVIVLALEQAGEAGASSLKYSKTILDSWTSKGITEKEQAERDIKQHQLQKGGSNSGSSQSVSEDSSKSNSEQPETILDYR
jgi:DnaD/phage-associated family protein